MSLAKEKGRFPDLIPSQCEAQKIPARLPPLRAGVYTLALPGDFPRASTAPPYLYGLSVFYHI